MEWLNYHHLLYFWTVAKEGGLAPAGELLRLARPTLSGQIAQLEDRLGVKLFEKHGRKLQLTETGKVVYRYADDIFRLGKELQEVLKRTGPVRLPLTIGVTDVLAKLVVRRLIEPAIESADELRLKVLEDTQERLLVLLASHEVDVVLSDAPVPAGSGLKVFSHLLGACGVTFHGVSRFEGLAKGFPKSLHRAPMLLPLEGTPLRRALDAWFSRLEISPRIVAEFEDSALLKVFGSDGFGVFPVPSIIDDAVRTQYRVQAIGSTTGVKEEFFALSAERKLRHPAVLRLTEAARHELFGKQ